MEIKTVRELYNEGMELFHPLLKGGEYIDMRNGQLCACVFGVIEMGATHVSIHHTFDAYNLVNHLLGLENDIWSYARQIIDGDNIRHEGYDEFTSLEAAFDYGVMKGKFTIDQLLDMAQARVDWERNAQTIAT